MKKTILLVALAVLFIGASGCAGHKMIVPPAGLIYTSYKAPLEPFVSRTDFGSKHGVSETRYLQLWYRPLSVGWEDASLRRAAENGGITVVKHADYEFLSVFSLYQELTIHAYGD